MASTATQLEHPESQRILDRNDPRARRLHEIISQRSLQTGDFILSSGVPSKYLFQLRQTTMLPEGAALIGQIVVEYMQREGLKCIGGLELGAVPLVAAIAVVSHYACYPVNAFFVRKKAKEHGAREKIDGYVRNGEEVMFADDVATSGKSILAAIEGMKTEYPTSPVRRAFVVVDRQEGATEMLASHGIKLISLFKKSDFSIGV